MDDAGRRRRWTTPVGMGGCAAVVIVTAVSMFVPIGGRPGVILQPGDVPAAWRAGVARGVVWYRYESPPLFRGQQLMWKPTLLEDDPFGPWHRNLSWWKVTGTKREVPGKVLEWSLPAWPLGVAALGWLLWCAGLAVRRRRRAMSGRCVWCGYARGGNIAGGACVECGKFP